MVPRTRRHLLQGVAALLAGLAGCQGTSTSSTGSNDPNHAENAEHDPERVGLRNPAGGPAAWVAEDGDDAPPSPEGRPRVTRRESRLIASESVAARLRYADVDDVEPARAFVDGTDFERETLLLETRVVEECYRLDLCGVTWSATSYHTYFGRTRRPADVACRVDATDRVAWLIRIPDVVDPDRVRSRGTGTSGRGCGGYRRRFEDEFDGDATEPTPNATSASDSEGVR